MRKSIKAFHEFAHNTEDAPGVCARKIKVDCPLDSMLFLFDLLFCHRFINANEWLRGATQQSLIFSSRTFGYRTIARRLFSIAFVRIYPIDGLSVMMIVATHYWYPLPPNHAAAASISQY